MNSHILTNAAHSSVWEFPQCKRVMNQWNTDHVEDRRIVEISATVKSACILRKSDSIFSKIAGLFGKAKVVEDNIKTSDIPALNSATLYVYETEAGRIKKQYDNGEFSIASGDFSLVCAEANGLSIVFNAEKSAQVESSDADYVMECFCKDYLIAEDGTFSLYLRGDDTYKITFELGTVKMSSLPLEYDWTQLTWQKLTDYAKEHGKNIAGLAEKIAYSDYAIDTFKIFLSEVIGDRPVNLRYKNSPQVTEVPVPDEKPIKQAESDVNAQPIQEKQDVDSAPLELGSAAPSSPRTIKKVKVHQKPEQKVQETTEQTEQVVKRARSTKKVSQDEPTQADAEKKPAKKGGRPKIKQVKEIKIKKVSKNETVEEHTN